MASRSLTRKQTWLKPVARQRPGALVDSGGRMVEREELHLLVDRCAFEHQGHMVGLPVRDAHVASDLLARGHDGDPFDEAEEPEEPLRLLEVGDDDRHVVEAFGSRARAGAHGDSAPR